MADGPALLGRSGIDVSGTVDAAGVRWLLVRHSTSFQTPIGPAPSTGHKIGFPHSGREAVLLLRLAPETLEGKAP